MELSGEQRIEAPRQKVWEALNDPEVLKQCIPGCQHIEKSGENEFTAKVKAKVGPVNSTFSGKVTLTNLNPPESYTISGQGTGGAAGFAKGGADVQLEDEGDATRLKYQVNAQVGGKLAQVGQRLIQSTANKYASQFFDTFTKVVGEAEAEGKAPAEAAKEEAPAPAAPAEAAKEAPRAEPERAAARPESAARPAETAEQKPAGGIPQGVWIGGAVVVVLILLAIFAF